MLPTVLAALAASAFAPLPQGSGSSPLPITPVVVAAADADHDGGVSAAEWQALLHRVAPAGAAALDRRTALAALLLARLDGDGDGAWSSAEIEPLWSGRDRDGDGVLRGDEVTWRGGRPGRGSANGAASDVVAGALGAIAAARADANKDGEITRDEWHALAGASERVDQAALVAWLDATIADVPADRGAFTPGTWLLTLDAAVDVNRDAAVDGADFAALFKAADRNGDGALSSDEIAATAPARVGRGPGRGTGREVVAVSADDRRRPALMPWQRNLADALAVQQRTGQPLLVCVNIDGETASESLAWQRYRDPEFAALAAGFVCVLASPDRHDARDYDDRGRRLIDTKFGRLTNAEHIDIEPQLFERWFHGRRVAPRHLAVGRDGAILFDIYLTNDLGEIDAALRQHGVPAAPVDAAALANEALLDQPDAACRDELERRFVDAAVSQRVALARRALTVDRRTQHGELLRLALGDADGGVRQAGLEAMLAAPAHADLALFAIAPAVFADDLVTRVRLAQALREHLAAATDAMARRQATALLRVLEAEAVASRLLRVEAWRDALQAAPILAPGSMPQDELDAALERCERELRARPRDAEVNRTYAELTLCYAELRRAAGHDPTLLLEEARSYARSALAIDPRDARARGVDAEASYLLGDAAAALPAATAALPDLLPHAAQPATARLLASFAQMRIGAIYGAMTADEPWPALWFADARAAHAVLRLHPAATEAQVVAGLDFAAQMQASADLPAALREAVARFPDGPEVHARVRELCLAQGGAARLLAFYADLPTSPSTDWFAGLATLIAAEHVVRDRQADAGLVAYAACIERFRRAIAANAAFADSANHYIALASSGSARLHLAAGRLVQAAQAAAQGITARPASAETQDGLGQTPAKTVGDVAGALEAAGPPELAELAAKLRAATERRGG